MYRTVHWVVSRDNQCQICKQGDSLRAAFAGEIGIISKSEMRYEDCEIAEKERPLGPARCDPSDAISVTSHLISPRHG